MKILLRILVISALLLLIFVIAVSYAIYNSDPAQQEVLEEQNFNEEIGEMEITVENSRIELLPSDDDAVRIVLTGNSEDFTLRTDATEGHLVVEVEDRSSLFNFDFNRSFALEVYVPESGLDSMSVESDNGAIQVTDIQAAVLMLETDNGRISLDTIESERIHAETDNGRIEAANIEADMTFQSANGRLIFTDISGAVQAKANNGRIELETETLAFPVDFETDNGRIEIRTDNEPANARIEANTGNGSIDIYGRENEESIFGDGDILIRLESNNGRVTVQ